VVGWEADGVLGMLLAVPFAASLRAAWECSGGSHIGRELLRFLSLRYLRSKVKNEAELGNSGRQGTIKLLLGRKPE
jgi:hypothetical protein